MARSMVCGVRVASFLLIVVFIYSYNWAISSSNNVAWGMPSADLPREFYVTNQIADKVRALKIRGQVLASHEIAAWLPLELPSVRLVMPGHTYPIQLQTILPRREYEARIQLYNAVNSGDLRSPRFANLIKRLDVELIVVPSDRDSMLSPFMAPLGTNGVRAKKIDVVDGYSLYQIY